VESVSNTICGVDNGEITFGFNPFYGYGTGLLYETTNGYITSGATATSGLTFSNLSGGTYYILGDDGGGCSGLSASVVILTSTTLDYGSIENIFWLSVNCPFDRTYVVLRTNIVNML
jgi:hypothetical protein